MSQAEELLEHALQNLRGPRAAEDVQSTPAELLARTEPRLTTPAEAIARCRSAWQNAYDACMKKSAGKMSRSVAELESAAEAAAAYRAAMPELAHWCGIRDFIACVAYGILIDAIPSERTGQLLYAAQTALALLPRTPTN
jgi:hypothetical protein